MSRGATWRQLKYRTLLRRNTRISYIAWCEVGVALIYAHQARIHPCVQLEKERCMHTTTCSPLLWADHSPVRETAVVHYLVMILLNVNACPLVVTIKPKKIVAEIMTALVPVNVAHWAQSSTVLFCSQCDRR